MGTAPATSPTNVHAKALAINLEDSIYGTFAEIGAGQEVARWFLSVGAASGTVAQTISAYDKTVSDDTYGAGTRYVSKERLLAMLDYEYQLLLSRLGPSRGARSHFFVFADTVSARNYQGTNEQHGWLGFRFQSEPGGDPNQVLLHINLGDSTADLQQEAVGLLGVNLVYAAFHQRSSAEVFLSGLFDELSMDRIEIDVLELSGSAFSGSDSRVFCLELLRRCMSHAIVFDSKARAVEPSSALRKRALIVLRSTYSHPELFDPELLRRSQQQLLSEGTPLQRQPAFVLEMTVRDASGLEAFDEADVSARIDQLASLGSVIVTDYFETYRLVHYLRRHTTEPIRLVLGVSTMAKILQESFYQALPGALLEGLGRLLATNVKIYVAPMSAEAFLAALGGLPADLELKTPALGLVTVDDIVPASPTDHLFKYLRAANRIVPLATGEEKLDPQRSS
jgi:hypothetical protein